MTFGHGFVQQLRKRLNGINENMESPSALPGDSKSSTFARVWIYRKPMVLSF